MRSRFRTVALLALGLLALVACSADSAEMAGDTAGVDADMEQADVDQATDADDGEEEAALDAGEDAAPLEVADAGSPDTGERIIREGTMTVEVEEDGYDAASARLIEAARGLGGTLVSSSSQTTDAGASSGTLTVRVPVDSYEDLLTTAGGLGTVRTSDITSQDVTGEYTDTTSRLRHERAQEAFYLELLDDAASVPEAVEVQQQLGGVQERIERLQGRINVLDDRTAFSTLTVALVEPDAAPLRAGGDEAVNLGAYVEQAQRAFVTVVGWLIVLAGLAAPVLIPLLLAALAWRLFRRPPPTTPPTPPARPAGRDDDKEPADVNAHTSTAR